MFPNSILAGTFNQSSGGGNGGGGSSGTFGGASSATTLIGGGFGVNNSTRIGNLFIENQNNLYLYTSEVASGDNVFYSTNGGAGWSQASYLGNNDVEQTKTAMAFKDNLRYWIIGGSGQVAGTSSTYQNNSNPVLLRSSNPVTGAWRHNTIGGLASGTQIHSNAYRYSATNYFTPQTIKVIPDGQDNGGVNQFIFLIFGYEVVSGGYKHGIFRKRSANLDESAYFTKVYQMSTSTTSIDPGNFNNNNYHSPYAIEHSGNNIYARYNIPASNNVVPNATVWYSSNKGVSFTALSLASDIGSTEIFHNGAGTDGTNWLFTTTADNSGGNSDAGKYIYYSGGTATKYDLTSLANNTNPLNTSLKMPWFGVKYLNGLWFLLNANGRIVYTDDPTDTSSWTLALYNQRGDGGSFSADAALGNGAATPNGYMAFESDGNSKLHYVAREFSSIGGTTTNRINHYIITVT